MSPPAMMERLRRAQKEVGSSSRVLSEGEPDRRPWRSSSALASSTRDGGFDFASLMEPGLEGAGVLAMVDTERRSGPRSEAMKHRGRVRDDVLTREICDTYVTVAQRGLLRERHVVRQRPSPWKVAALLPYRSYIILLLQVLSASHTHPAHEHSR
jgi:hypothetical protein